MCRRREHGAPPGARGGAADAPGAWLSCPAGLPVGQQAAAALGFCPAGLARHGATGPSNVKVYEQRGEPVVRQRSVMRAAGVRQMTICVRASLRARSRSSETRGS